MAVAESTVPESTATDNAVVVDDVSMRFRMFRERNNSFKTALMRGRKSDHEDYWALQNVSFTVPKGTTFGIIGRNGAGKSTLLKCLAKIYPTTSGSISYQGKMASMLELGSGFHPELSGRENIYLNASILGLSRKQMDERVEDVIKFSGVPSKFIEQPVKNYSSGMYVRLGFSVAINVNPDVLVVDEILAVGDGSFKEKSRKKFIELKDSGKTVIMVSHSAKNIVEMCDSVAWLEQGRLVKVGPAKEVMDEYTAALKEDE